MDHLVYDLQATSIALGIFACIWGLQAFGKCLWEILIGHTPHHRMCPFHAGVAVVCIIGLIFAAARANTVGLINMGTTFSGLLFTGGMIGFTVLIGLAIWAKDYSHTQSFQDARVGHSQLRKVFSMVFIVILAFILVGLVKAGMSD
jgi:hypothetical protein